MICFLDHERNKLVSIESIKESYRENIASGGIDSDITYDQYVKMICDPRMGFCSKVFSLSDIMIDYFGNACFVADFTYDIDCRLANAGDIET